MFQFFGFNIAGSAWVSYINIVSALLNSWNINFLISIFWIYYLLLLFWSFTCKVLFKVLKQFQFFLLLLHLLLLSYHFLLICCNNYTDKWFEHTFFYDLPVFLLGDACLLFLLYLYFLFCYHNLLLLLNHLLLYYGRTFFLSLLFLNALGLLFNIKRRIGFDTFYFCT